MKRVLLIMFVVAHGYKRISATRFNDKLNQRSALAKCTPLKKILPAF